MNKDDFQLEDLPIRREDAAAAAGQFRINWDYTKLMGGIQSVAEDALHKLQDSGDLLLLTHQEITALNEHLSESGLMEEVFRGGAVTLSDELKSAVKKIAFAWGRCYGMTNMDMGIKEDDDD